MSAERIQKVLAGAGFGSRRSCELLVLDGRVRVNGKTVLVLPVIVDPDKDAIAVDGKAIRRENVVYYLLNKPRGVHCTQRDPAGRRRAVDLLKGVRERVFPVGRLDADSAGLLIMTNDGALAQRLTHPSFGIPKTYRVEVGGHLEPEALERLRGGVWLAEGKTGRAAVQVIYKQRDKLVLEVTLREGRNREIRRMLVRAGCKVRRLTRIRMGKLSIRKLGLGAYRRLSVTEVRYLQSLEGRVPKGVSPRRAVGAKKAPAGRSAPGRRTEPRRKAGPGRKRKGLGVGAKRVGAGRSKGAGAAGVSAKRPAPKDRKVSKKGPGAGGAKTGGRRRILLP
jgi:pseudouridine synthase